MKTKNPNKPHTWLSDELRVHLVAEARFTPSNGLPALLARYGVSARTLERCKHMVAESPALASLLDARIGEIQEQWRDAGNAAMRATLAAIQEQAAKARELGEFNPQAMRTCAGAAKILGELLLGDAILARTRPASRPSRATSEKADCAATPPVH
jgi:hypothetical protein